MKDQKELSELKKGEAINHFLLVTSVEVKTSRNNKRYLDLQLRDKSINLPAKMWDNFDQFEQQADKNKIVKVDGFMDEYMGQPQIKVNRIRLANTKEASMESFLPKSNRDINEMLKEFDDIVNSIQNVYLKKLLGLILSKDNYSKYIRVPAGKAWHHAYVHGLLEHTLELVKICDLMCGIHPEIDRDLLISGALLHDFGKIEELSSDGAFDYTDKGKLVGHIVIASMEIEAKAAQVENFPTDLKDRLIHLVLSHQGKLEFASPVEPKTVEAIVLYQADELSAKTNAYKSAVLSESNKEGNWTKFLKLANTALYIPPQNAEEQDKESPEKTNLFE
jgi:3'-5' exoribonuclease